MQQDRAYVWAYVIIKYNIPDSNSNGKNEIFNQIRSVYLNTNHKSNQGKVWYSPSQVIGLFVWQFDVGRHVINLIHNG